MSIDGRPVDRLPFWPKIDASYGRAQSGRFASMNNSELHAWIGSEPPIGLPSCVRSIPNGYNLQVVEIDGVQNTSIETPVGQLHSSMRYDEDSASWHPIEHPIKAKSDIETMIWIYDHNRIELDPEALNRSKQLHNSTGQSGATLEAIETSALMDFVEFLAGVEDAHYYLADYPDLVAELFDAKHKNILARVALCVEHSPADLLMMVENTSTTLISPDQYSRFCASHITEYGNLIQKADRRLVLHMCGHLRALLDQLSGVGAAAFEAFTTPPVGNTSLAAGREACPDICLIGGTNAALWLNSADLIIDSLDREFEALDELRGIIPSSAGVMPPAATPETIRRVCDWIKNYSKRAA